MRQDTYQAVYDAVRSRIGSCDVSAAVSSAIRDAGIGDIAHTIGQEVRQLVSCQTDPSVLYRPKLTLDGNQWCALYGEDLQNGVAGFGVSPAEAMANFNTNWWAKVGTTEDLYWVTVKYKSGSGDKTKRGLTLDQLTALKEALALDETVLNVTSGKTTNGNKRR